MKCIYCGENIKSWFFRAHQECYDQYIDQYNEVLKICVDYEKGNVEHSVAVKSLIKMTEQDNFYKKILLQDTETFNDIIRKNDIPIFFSKYFSVVEEKNSCRMKRVFRYFISAIVMLIVAVMTCTLTTKIKIQQAIKAEAEKEKMRANLLRAVSHDLRTPLTTIYGACGVLRENYDTFSRQKQLELLGQVQEDSESLIHMVENLLMITKANSDTVRLEKTETVLEELIDSTLIKFKKHYPDSSYIHPGCVYQHTHGCYVDPAGNFEPFGECGHSCQGHDGTGAECDGQRKTGDIQRQ